MATSSTSQRTSQDEYKYFKEFTRLVANKRKEVYTDKNIWLWDFMQNTLRLTETIMTSPEDIDTLVLTAGDFLTDLFLICSAMRFSASKEHERDITYTFSDNTTTTHKLMQTTRWFIYHYKAYNQSKWKRLQALTELKDIAERLCQTVMGICKADNLHDLLRTRIQRGLSHCKLHRERTRHIMHSPQLAPMLTSATIHPVTYDLMKTEISCPPIAKFLSACGVDMKQKHVTLSQVTEKVYTTLINFTEARHRTIKETTDMLVKQIFTTERMIDLTDHRSLWWPIGKWLHMETYEEQFNTKYPDSYRLYAPDDIQIYIPCIPDTVAVLQSSETITISESDAIQQQEITDTQSEMNIACNILGKTPLPGDVMEFLNINSDQQTAGQSEHGEEYKLPFSDVIFYSDSE